MQGIFVKNVNSTFARVIPQITEIQSTYQKQ